MNHRSFLRRVVAPGAALVGAALAFSACIEPPPKIAAIPMSGLALRVYVFGASAEQARQTFDAVKQNNPNFSIVQDGGDGEVLVGLDQDTGACVEPTALCAFKVSYRIKNAKGDVVRAETQEVQETSDRCSLLCDKALRKAVIQIVEHAALNLKGPGETVPDASATPSAAASASPEAGKEKDKDKEAKAPKKREPVAAGGKFEPAICAVGAGPRLPAEEAERRVGQVEALKRMGVLEQDEFECLKKALLARL
ncbi:MAG TPA: hypothetical protein VHB21_01940 [Minicystis sp.]|nr:hypothetical protein [Minicystis sp.]